MLAFRSHQGRTQKVILYLRSSSSLESLSYRQALSISMAQKRFSALALLLLVSLSHLASADFFPDDPDDDLFPERHERARRFIRVFSRKPDPDAEPESGIGFGGHMKNLMKGGTVKFELKIPDNILKFPFFKELDDFPVSREERGNDPKKDFGMLEREEDYGPLINPRVKGDP